ncbi:MAG: metallophosphoesterase [Solirubrobacteraceae bacterium]
MSARVRKRRLIALGALMLLAAIVVVATARRSGDDGAPGAGSDAIGDTRRVTLVDRDGDGSLRRGRGEPLRDRTTLAPAVTPGKVLATFGQITDAHVRDEESPALVGFLDRLGGPFRSTFRPHETLTTQVLDAAVRSLNTARPGTVIVTGDLIDNNQRNELQMALSALDGGTVRPDSGARGYDGPQLASNPDPSYYRPAVDPPQQPGLLDAAQRGFRSQGLRAPWWSVTGNHDLLVSGEIATTPRLQAVAKGGEALVKPPRDLPIPRDESALAGGVDALLTDGLPGTTTPRPADPARAQLTAAEVLDKLRATGHGRGSGPSLDYTIDLGPAVRAIVLDTVRRDRGSGGLLRAQTLSFLRRQLAAAGTRWVVVFSHQPLATASGGDAALALLDSEPRVLATVAGHTHRNRITARATRAGGYWQLTTASLVDFPQQARMLRIRETPGDGAVIETWMLDTARAALSDSARSLAFLDAQGGRPHRARGRLADRNVRLFR